MAPDQDLDGALKALPKFPRVPDEPGEFQVDVDDDIEIEIEPVIVVASEMPAASRAITAPLGANARAVRALQLAAERKRSAEAGLVPISERLPAGADPK